MSGFLQRLRFFGVVPLLEEDVYYQSIQYLCKIVHSDPLLDQRGQLTPWRCSTTHTTAQPPHNLTVIHDTDRGSGLYDGGLYSGRLYGGTLPTYNYTAEFFSNADSSAELEKNADSTAEF